MDNISKISEYFKEALLETIPCSVFMVDGKHRVIYWNKSAEELSGYKACDIIGSVCETLPLNICANISPEVKKTFCPLLSGNNGSEVECELLRRDGVIIPVMRRSRPVFNDKKEIIGAIEVLIDVSLIKQARDEIRVLRNQMAKHGSCGGLVGRSEKMLKLYNMIEMLAATDASVVIEGQTGTGKELVARTIHCQSSRRDKVFLAVNCGALPETLLEAELFGHKKGAFTGAVEDRAGCFETASGGTLFLDEIAEMPPSFQVKLLRVLQERSITRVGDSVARAVDVRVIAASNKSLSQLVDNGLFRKDLYYRLKVVSIEVPPLRERKDDIPHLVSNFVRKFNERYNRHIENIAPQALNVLMSYNWPGNVRELEHSIEHSFVVTPLNENIITIDSLPPEIIIGKTAVETKKPASACCLDEKEQLLQVLEHAGGNKTVAAALLGITRAGLYKKMRRLKV